jgi:hypothetical protein
MLLAVALELFWTMAPSMKYILHGDLACKHREAHRLLSFELKLVPLLNYVCLFSYRYLSLPKY